MKSFAFFFILCTEREIIYLYLRDMREFFGALLILFFLGCSMKSELTIEDKLNEIQNKYDQGYYTRAQSELEKILPSLRKGSNNRKKALELYAGSFDNLDQYDKAAQTYLQLVEEYPLDPNLREWMLKASSMLLKSRSRDDSDISPIEKSISIINQIRSKWGELNEEEKVILGKTKQTLKEYYERVLSFYRRKNKPEAVELYLEKLAQLESK